MSKELENKTTSISKDNKPLRKKEIYFGSKDEIGDLVCLGDYSIIKGRIGWKNLRQDEYVNSGIAMIAGKHINNGIINWDRVDRITEHRYLESPEIMLQESDIIFSKDGSIGNPAHIRNLVESATINGTMMLLRMDSNFDSEYIYQYLTSKHFKKLVSLKTSGSSIPHLFQSDMKEFKIPIKSMNEQEQIATFLSQIDNLISNENNKIFMYKATTLYLLKYFINIENDIIECKISDIFKITRGDVLSKNLLTDIGYPVYSSQTLNNGLMGYYSEYLFENCITWTTDGANAGTTKYRQGKFYCTNVCGVLISDEGYSNKYVAEKLNLLTPKYVSFVGNPKLMNSEMANIKIKIPKLEQQLFYSNILSQMDKLIEIEEKKLEKLNLMKKYYLQQFFD